MSRPSEIDAAHESAAPKRRAGLLSHSMLSSLDQAWLSALNLVLGLVLIRLATKDEYGVYSQLFVGGLFITTVVDALLTHPLMTALPGLEPLTRQALLQRLSRLQLGLAVGLALLGGVAYGVAAHQAGDAQIVPIALSFMLYLLSSSRREYQRGLSYIEGEPKRALIVDGIYGVVLALGVAVLAWQRAWLHLPGIFLVLSLANGVALLCSRRRVRLDAMPDLRQPMAQLWQRGKWALPGALMSWVVNYSYLYMTALWVGAAGSAELNASRLLLMPVSLCVIAWAKVGAPTLSRTLQAQDTARLRRILGGSAVGLTVLALGYLVLVCLLLPLLEKYVLGPDYAGVQSLVLLWGLYFWGYAMHWLWTAFLMAADRYRELLGVSLLALVVLVISLPLMLMWYGTTGAVIALIIVEVATVVMQLWLAWPWLMGRAQYSPR
ncbi:lipopolysaccharide biosynthesis protein [Kerstersia sp.]|uniref:lipopolysaccharide biosynthesis protein n=1 Tax=Kerstersia sp. TaxID=1930783 RepID=UPI003F93908B